MPEANSGKSFCGSLGWGSQPPDEKMPEKKRLQRKNAG